MSEKLACLELYEDMHLLMTEEEAAFLSRLILITNSIPFVHPVREQHMLFLLPRHLFQKTLTPFDARQMQA